jgi:hypothetical protein
MLSAAGEMSAAPMPCAVRETMSATGDCARASLSEARVKIAAPSVNKRRRPNRSADRPPSNRNPPNESVYAVTTYCRSPGVKRKSRAIVGSATFVTVASRTTMNWARQTVATSAVFKPATLPSGVAGIWPAFGEALTAEPRMPSAEIVGLPRVSGPHREPVIRPAREVMPRAALPGSPEVGLTRLRPHLHR